MTHIFLYSTATEAGEPSAALQSAVQKMHDLVADLETKHRFVAVQGHSHTVIPAQVTGTSLTGRPRAGYSVTLTTVVEIPTDNT